MEKLIQNTLMSRYFKNSLALKSRVPQYRLPSGCYSGRVTRCTKRRVYSSTPAGVSSGSNRAQIVRQVANRHRLGRSVPLLRIMASPGSVTLDLAVAVPARCERLRSSRPCRGRTGRRSSAKTWHAGFYGKARQRSLCHARG